MTKQFLPEESLLISCSTLPACSCFQRQYDANYFPSNLDWQFVLKQASRHGTSAILYFILGKLKDKEIPKPVLSQLKNLQFKLAARNLHMAGQLNLILDLFEKHTIPLITFKGPVLAMQAYDNLSLRIFCDLDLLVNAEDLIRIHALLLANGFRSELSLTASELTAIAKHENELAFTNDTTNITIDLHWDLSRHYLNYKLDSRYYSDRLQIYPFSGRKIQTLNDEDLLIYLCLHGAKHGWQRLEWLGNLAALINRKNGLVWEVVIERSQEIGTLRMVLLAAALIDDFFGTPLPDDIHTRIRNDPQLPMLKNLVKENLFSEAQPTHPLEIRFSKFHFLIRDTWLDKFLYGFRLLFLTSKEDWIKTRLPASLSFLYYLLRPIRLGSECLKKIFYKLSSGSGSV